MKAIALNLRMKFPSKFVCHYDNDQNGNLFHIVETQLLNQFHSMPKQPYWGQFSHQVLGGVELSTKASVATQNA